MQGGITGGSGAGAFSIALLVKLQVRQPLTKAGDDVSPRGREPALSKLVATPDPARIAVGATQNERVRNLMSCQRRGVRKLYPKVTSPRHLQSSNASAGTA